MPGKGPRTAAVPMTGTAVPQAMSLRRAFPPAPAPLPTPSAGDAPPLHIRAFSATGPACDLKWAQGPGKSNYGIAARAHLSLGSDLLPPSPLSPPPRPWPCSTNLKRCVSIGSSFSFIKFPRSTLREAIPQNLCSRGTSEAGDNPLLPQRGLVGGAGRRGRGVARAAHTAGLFICE